MESDLIYDRSLLVTNTSEKKTNKGAASGELASGGKEVAIQANDYEIERGSSHLPQRKRFVPLRFR